MQMNDLWEEIKYCLKTLDKAVVDLKERGIAAAQAEHDYRVKLANRLLQLRAEGLPVTIISDIARGEPETAKLKLQRDIAESLCKSCEEGINVNKHKLKIISEQNKQEWGQAGRN
jgi:hypothetical protein